MSLDDLLTNEMYCTCEADHGNNHKEETSQPGRDQESGGAVGIAVGATGGG